jgi:hypothetical protein
MIIRMSDRNHIWLFSFWHNTLFLDDQNNDRGYYYYASRYDSLKQLVPPPPLRLQLT